MKAKALIAIVGRPNVGKSTLFNRLLGKKLAIVAKEKGTTRDRITQNFECNGYETILIDTGGIESEKKENIEKDVQLQAKIAIEDSDIIVLVVDLQESLTSEDFHAASLLKRTKKPVLLLANKCDHPNMQDNVLGLYELGLGEPMEVSTIHNLGIEELKQEITNTLKKLKFKKTSADQKKEKDTTNICILGRPNAGKSSLINSIIGENRLIVSEIPGTTRDTVDIEVTHNDKKYNFIDTAGLKKPGKIKPGIEKFSALRCLSAIERSDIVVILLDGNEQISHQDSQIASFAVDSGKGIIIAVNKIDLLEDRNTKEDEIIKELQKKFMFILWAPVLFLSAKTKENIPELFSLAEEIKNEREKRINTGQLNSFMKKITFKHLPASTNVNKPKFLYASQVDINPPRFLMFFKNPANMHFSYPRYLENRIREEYGFLGTAIEIRFKNSSSSPKE